MEFTATPVASTSSKHGEGAVWEHRTQRLLWVDIDGKKVHRFDPVSGKDETLDVGSEIGTIVPRAAGGGMQALCALTPGFAIVDFLTKSVIYLARVHIVQPRYNDGKADPAGRFFVGTMAIPGQPGTAILTRLDPDLSLRTVLTGVTTSNGLVWTRDRRTMYYIDTPTMKVDAFDYDAATGAITNRRAAVAIPPGIGKPDGMTIDAEDRLWIAMWGGARVCCFAPRTGELLHTVHTPGARHSSSCALGGKDLDELLITTSRQGVKPEEYAPGGAQASAGMLFRCRVPAKGVAAGEFGG